MQRRNFLKTGLCAAALPLAGRWPARAAAPLAIDLTNAPPTVRTGHLSFGMTRNPNGRSVSADSRSLLFDGGPWSPVMGEFHYSRYPAAEWRDELLKMKAGGIDIAATYVFWLHHEEIEGQWDWSGQRDLRRFVELCGEVGLYAMVRCGPWCHGEARNGGFPDWLLQKGWRLRSDDALYLDKTRLLYGEISKQIKGLLWKEGGPVVGVQFENEYRGPAEHLLTLKRIALEAGLDVPLYTRTGWPELRTKMPVGAMLPLFGSYADGFWDRNLTDMPGGYGETFLFKLQRNDAEVATDQLGRRITKDSADTNEYPYLCCEIGGGMERSYHRRILIKPADVYASAFVKLGSGNNLQGYYMYHGGTHPTGKLSTLQESQATNYWNDLPVKSYDFQAPLGEFGQIRPHYHQLRLTHLFLRDFGPTLAQMPATLPTDAPATPKDSDTLRWAVRSDGASGYIFVSNYHRLREMPRKANVQFELKLKSETLRVPSALCSVPADSAFFLPFNLDLDGVKLAYASAQPICRVEEKGAVYYVFAQIAGVAPEFVLAGKAYRDLRPGTSPAVTVHAANGKQINILLLDEKQALGCWKGTLAGREGIFLTHAGLILDGANLRLTAENAADLAVSIFPAPAALRAGGKAVKSTKDGIFRRFAAPVPKTPAVRVTVEQIQPHGPARGVKMGSKGVAEAPTDEDFKAAAVWRVKFPAGLDQRRDLLLRARYAGDVARFYLDGVLLIDNFYNGNVFDLGLRRYAPDVYAKALLLKILPLRKDAPIYLQTEARPDFAGAESVARLDNIAIIERFEAQLQ